MKNKVLCVILGIALLLPLGSVCVYAYEDDSELLARAVEAVASDGSYTVMVSLASVMLNRLESDSYPGSLAAVISDAGIDISAVEPSARALRASRDALGGFDPTRGATEYSKSRHDDSPILLFTDGWCFY